MTMYFEGNVDDLLYVSDDNKIKLTRLVNIDKDCDPENEEVLDLTLTSSSNNGNHFAFDKCLGKKMRVIVNFVDV